MRPRSAQIASAMHSGIVAGMLVAECDFRVAVQSLPVNEGNGALGVGFGGCGGKK